VLGRLTSGSATAEDGKQNRPVTCPKANGGLPGRPGSPILLRRLSALLRASGRSPEQDSRPPRMRKIGLVRTFSPKVTEIQRSWYVVDADGLVLGRLASSVAAILRGKHRPYFAPHVDTGDHVIVVNADKVVLTSNKADDKLAYRHSGYPGGLRSTSYANLLENKPAELVRRSVRGMLPKNTLGRQQLSKLQVYAGPEHPHAAQKPEPLELPDARRAG
jgi:large subunit ribosomal protein L13